MSKISRKTPGGGSSGSTTKYDAHHTVLAKTYGAQAGLRRELSDSKAAVAERAGLLNTFADCNDPQRAWLLLEDYFEKLSLSRKDFASHDWWPRVLSARGKKRLEETAILFLRSSRPLPTELLAHANPAPFCGNRADGKGTASGAAPGTLAFPQRAPPIWIPRAPPSASPAKPGRWGKTPPCMA